MTTLNWLKATRTESWYTPGLSDLEDCTPNEAKDNGPRRFFPFLCSWKVNLVVGAIAPVESLRTLWARTRTNNKLNPHVTPDPWIEPGPHWWEASAFTTATSLLPIFESTKMYRCQAEVAVWSGGWKYCNFAIKLTRSKALQRPSNNDLTHFEIFVVSVSQMSKIDVDKKAFAKRERSWIKTHFPFRQI